MDTVNPAHADDLYALAHQQSRLRESAAIDQIVTALIGLQGTLRNPERNRAVEVEKRNGSTYSHRYATLDAVLDACLPPLGEHRLALIQPLVSTPQGTALLTRLMHVSGQWMEAEALLPRAYRDDPSPQALGSFVTYLRRYCLLAMLGIAPNEDDDANSAAGNKVTDVTPRRQDSSPAQPGPAQPGPAQPGEDGGRPAAKGQARAPAQETAVHAAVRHLNEQACVAASFKEGHTLLADYLKVSDQIATLRGTDMGTRLMDELRQALRRCLGVDVAAAFATALRLASQDQVAILKETLGGKWAESLRGLKANFPETYALLDQHIAEQVRRVSPAPQPEPTADIPEEDGAPKEDGQARGQAEASAPPEAQADPEAQAGASETGWEAPPADAPAPQPAPTADTAAPTAPRAKRGTARGARNGGASTDATATIP